MPPAVPSTRLLVLRHGQSEWNAQGRWQGHADVPLDDVGRAQADEAAQRVAALGAFAAVWSSDLQRAIATAQAVADALGRGPVHLDARLRENDVGPWEGLNQQEVDHGWPGFLIEKRRPEGFESYDAASARMIAGFRDIAAHHPRERVVVVSHGGIVRATRRALGAPDEHLPNLGGTWFTVDPDGEITPGDIIVLRERRQRSSPEAATGVL